MVGRTIAILSPGDMGHACGRAFRQHGLHVVTCLAGRSARTRGLAAAAGFEDLPSLEAVAAEADLILSILPPAAARQQARQIAKAMEATGRTPAYADCNAISPATVRAVGAEIARVGASFIDAGIIGLAPGRDTAPPRFYASGPDTTPLEALDGAGIIVRPLGTEIGRASALKMVYAAVSKGTWTLHAAALTAAHAMDLIDPYLRELEESRPHDFAVMNRMVPRLPLDAGRWHGEMLEIAATLESVGVTGGFHRAAAEVFELMLDTPIAEETRETVDENRTLREALGMYVSALHARGDGSRS